ncbi:MAG: SRPBCC domain-containing protein, partial [Solirubrobacteraceae bacterium]
MKVGGEITLAAPTGSLWTRLSDPRMLESALPVVGAVDLHREDEFSVEVAPATGLGVTPMLLDVKIADRREGEHVTLHGGGRGGEYAVRFTVVLDLSQGDEGCAVRWTAEAS